MIASCLRLRRFVSAPCSRAIDGGLDLAVEAVLDARTVWTSDIDPGACRIIDHRWPDAPNLGDIAAVDWSQVEPVDVITGGFPCQDVSHAGARHGLGPGTRTGLWARMADAIDHLRPSLVVAENVRGLLSAAADSNVEPCPWCMGGASDGQPPLRALGSVLADLADLGYDAAWHGLRASDVGAPHGRFRVFVLAWPTDTDVTRLEGSEPTAGRLVSARRAAADAGRSPRGRAVPRMAVGRDGETADVRRGPAEPRGRTGPAADAGAAGAGRNGRAVSGAAVRSGRPDIDVHAPRDARRDPAADAVRQRDGWRTEPRASDGRRLADGTVRRRQAAPDAEGHEQREPAVARPLRSESRDGATGVAWGSYGSAIRRWESVLGRPASSPTELSSAYVAMVARRRAGLDPRPVGRRGSLRPAQRLNPAFVEWMMGLPDGWVTAVPDLSRNDQLKALGNGVVPQQAAAALTTLLAWRHAALNAPPLDLPEVATPRGA